MYLWLLLPAVVWIVWVALKSDAHAAPWRRRTSLALRLLLVCMLVFALAGAQLLRPVEGMNLFFVMDRSESVPSGQQELARSFVNQSSTLKQREDKAGVIVFGNEASIESTPNAVVDLQKVQAVVDTERTDLAAAIRLGTAAFPETGQKRLALLTDGNENVGDALSAAMAARSLGVSIDVLPLGAVQMSDVFVQRLQIPPKVKQGQAFEAKIFVQSDTARKASMRLYRNDQLLGEQPVELEPGKNLFSFPQRLPEAGFYSYDARVDASGDKLPQNNRATSFTTVLGEPRVLVVSSDPAQDQPLATSLASSKLRPELVAAANFPGTLAQMQSYDSIFLCNVAAGELGVDRQKLLESAVRDYGVGLVAVGGDQAFTAGGYRGTPLENALPLNMELDSKKVMPSGAVVLVMHGMEFNNGNAVARGCAQGVLDALGPKDELGVVLWDGSERWLFPLAQVGDKSEARSRVAGMQQGDLGSFQGVLEMAQEALVKSKANLKHIIVFSDGDPAKPTAELMRSIVGNRITVSTVLIAGHFGPEHMMFMADAGRGRFYNVTSVADLPQVFIKETAVVLKTAIIEEEFRPRVRSRTEPVRGLDSFPPLLGYVATTPKARAEVPLWTPKEDPLLAHWQYGLGRAVAFTSDARSRWARDWMGWEQYRQFWSQIGQWSLRRLESSDLAVDVIMENGTGLLQIEALDESGEYRNFLNLQAVVNSPNGDRQTALVEQKGPGHYEARFAARQTGPYLLNILEYAQGRLRGSQVAGASVNYSPEYNAAGPNWTLLRKLSEAGGGKLLEAAPGAANPFLHDRRKTYQPSDLWEWLLRMLSILFVADVGLRRIQIDREEWARALAVVRQWLPGKKPLALRRDESLASLLERRKYARAAATPSQPHAPRPELLTSATPATVEPSAQPPAQPAPVAPEVKPATSEAPVGGETTASKLLAAKRRAAEERGKPRRG
jgi:uncharacterized membrane protein/Mg-chelatase subunit ChlD